MMKISMIKPAGLRRLLQPAAKIALIMIAALLGGSTAWGQAAGSLDPTFGTSGIITTSFGVGVDALGGFEQSNGDIVVVAGFDVESTESTAIGLVRYTSTGRLDTTFGTNGSTVTTFPGFTFAATGFAVQPNGDILVAGTATTSGGIDDFGLARFTSNGALDTTFDTGGLVTTRVGTEQDNQSALLLQSNGQIVVGGFEDGGGKKIPGQTALVRYNSNGSLDTTFGTGGISLVTPTVLGPQTLAQLSNGDYLAVGENESGAGNVVVEFSSTGALLSAVTAGTITAASQTPSFLFQSNGDFLVPEAVKPPAGTAPAGFTFPKKSSDAEVARFTETGTPDSTFESTPFTFVPITVSNLTEDDESEPGSLAFQSNGQIVVGGSLSGTAGGATTVFALARVNADGELDTTFGSNGTVTTVLSGNAGVNSVLVEANGDIVAIGGVFDKSTEIGNLVLARYLAN